MQHRLALGFAILALGCGSPESPVCRKQQAIVLREDTEPQPLPAWAAAVVRIDIESGALDARSHGTCTGTVVDAGIVLTAAHCLDGGADEDLRVTVTSARSLAGCDGAAADAVVAEGWLIHPELDAALVFVEELDARAIPLLDGPLTGEPELAIAGYGLDAQGSTGALITAEATLEEETDYFVVRGRDAGACVGDSGGPLVVLDELGEANLVGLLQFGAASCAARDFYLPIAALESWLTANAPNAVWSAP